MMPATSASRRTKIVATLGPSSSSAAVIAELLDSGVNIFRLNFSHGDAEQHTENARTVRDLAAQRDIHVGILGDLQGPKIRIGDLQQESKPLEDGQPLLLTVDESAADSRENRIHVVYSALPQSVAAGDTLLVDDGLIRLEVQSVEGSAVHCRVVQAGLLKSRKGLNRLGGGLSAAAMTNKDFADLDVIIGLDLEYVAVSFPASAADLAPVRKALEAAGSKTKIIAKIERAEAVASELHLGALIDAADGVMVARGDLGVEIGDAQLIGVQKNIIRLSRRANKPVITATQMMESMINQPIPTRAEVFDVANAVLDGTDAVMLSSETAAGQYPVKSVSAMAETALGAERHPTMRESTYRVDRSFDSIDETIAMSVIYAANHLTDLAAIICLTESGTTPLLASRLSSSLPIYGISPHLATCRRMALYRGVIPLFFDVTQAGKSDLSAVAMDLIARRGELQVGQRVAFTCGDMHGEGGSTNTLKLLQYCG